MKLLYSKTRLPYIELTTDAGDNYGTLIFSRSTQTDFGYKYMSFTHRHRAPVKIKKGKGYEMVEMEVNDSFVFNMRMKRDEAGIRGVPTGTIPRRLVDWIIATLDPFLVDGIMPFSQIENLKPVIEAADIDKILETVVKRKYTKKKKKKKAKKEKVTPETKQTGKLTDIF